MDWLQQLYDLFGTTYEYPYTDYQQINLDFVFSALAVLKEAIVRLQAEITETAQAQQEALDSAVESLNSDIVEAAHSYKFRLAANVTTTEDNFLIEIPLSFKATELYIQVYTPGDAVGSARIATYSNRTPVIGFNVSNIIASTARWWSCHILAFSPYPMALYKAASSATTASVTTAATLVHATLSDADESTKDIDTVELFRNGGSGLFRAGTKIKVYGR